MKVEKIDLTINGEVKDPIEITLREGEALKLVYPKKYKQTGVISAPRLFSEKIKDKTKAIVEYSIIEKYVKLFENPNIETASEVTGLITINPDLVAFGINKDVYFSQADLIKLARKYAHCFSSTDEAKELIKSLQNFEIAFEQHHIKADDRKGATEESVKNAIKFTKGEVKSQLRLSIPIFIGSPKVDFDVEVEVQRDGTRPVFGFYSINMESIIQEQVSSLINTELEVLKKVFTCIQIS